jgi:TRAP-type C4-dicarboxylate transport system permease small subunit
VKLFDWLLDQLAAVAAILILAIMIGIGIDVFVRSLLNRPIGWMLEYTEHALLLILLLGMPRLVRKGEHVGVDLLLNLVPPTIAWRMRIIAEFAAGVTCAIVAVAAGFGTRSDYVFGVETFGIYPLPRFVLMAVVTVGLALTAIEFLRLMVRTIAAGPQLRPVSEAESLIVSVK